MLYRSRGWFPLVSLAGKPTPKATGLPLAGRVGGRGGGGGGGGLSWLVAVGGGFRAQLQMQLGYRSDFPLTLTLSPRVLVERGRTPVETGDECLSDDN